MGKKYETNIAQSVQNGDIYEALDVFTCGLGLFAVMCPVGFGENSKDIVIMEILDLNGVKLSKVLNELNGLQPEEIIDDYCFIIAMEPVAIAKANNRKRDGLNDKDGLASLKINDARTVQEIDNLIGKSDSKTVPYLFVHKWKVIETD